MGTKSVVKSLLISFSHMTQLFFGLLFKFLSMMQFI